MLRWRIYSWADLDPLDLPWPPHSEQTIITDYAPCGLAAAVDNGREAISAGFDPKHTYYTTLSREWRSHPAGSRVLLEVAEIAIEDKDPSNAF